MNESILEPFLRKMRINKVLPIIKKYPNCKLLDIGCGFNYKFLLEVEPYISEGYGVDFKVPELKKGKIKTKQIKLDNKLPFDENSFDFVTMLAVLEHLDHPAEIVREIERVLKPKGKLILTVPSRNAKPVLEFLAYKLKIVNEEEINNHKKYYNYKDLEKLFKDTDKLKIQEHKYFQFYMNNFCVVKKEI
jgi:2-polyprenyl-3-methyl-5-hydroxy-6-metoxy-1,4-benzoquinol methylase